MPRPLTGNIYLLNLPLMCLCFRVPYQSFMLSYQSCMPTRIYPFIQTIRLVAIAGTTTATRRYNPKREKQKKKTNRKDMIVCAMCLCLCHVYVRSYRMYMTSRQIITINRVVLWLISSTILVKHYHVGSS